MRVGCPKEIKNHEYRVGLTPAAVREYVAHGHDVLVETGLVPASAPTTMPIAPQVRRSPPRPRTFSKSPI